jgi:hypothetical protein
MDLMSAYDWHSVAGAVLFLFFFANLIRLLVFLDSHTKVTVHMYKAIGWFIWFILYHVALITIVYGFSQ